MIIIILCQMFQRIITHQEGQAVEAAQYVNKCICTLLEIRL